MESTRPKRSAASSGEAARRTVQEISFAHFRVNRRPGSKRARAPPARKAKPRKAPSASVKQQRQQQRRRPAREEEEDASSDDEEEEEESESSESSESEEEEEERPKKRVVARPGRRTRIDALDVPPPVSAPPRAAMRLPRIQFESMLASELKSHDAPRVSVGREARDAMYLAVSRKVSELFENAGESMRRSGRETMTVDDF